MTQNTTPPSSAQSSLLKQHAALSMRLGVLMSAALLAACSSTPLPPWPAQSGSVTSASGRPVPNSQRQMPPRLLARNGARRSSNHRNNGPTTSSRYKPAQ
nr:hypothetical protein [Diaphorobacter aerolatus]